MQVDKLYLDETMSGVFFGIFVGMVAGFSFPIIIWHCRLQKFWNVEKEVVGLQDMIRPLRAEINELREMKRHDFQKLIKEEQNRYNQLYAGLKEKFEQEKRQLEDGHKKDKTAHVAKCQTIREGLRKEQDRLNGLYGKLKEQFQQKKKKLEDGYEEVKQQRENAILVELRSLVEQVEHQKTSLDEITEKNRLKIAEATAGVRQKHDSQKTELEFVLTDLREAKQQLANISREVSSKRNEMSNLRTAAIDFENRRGVAWTHLQQLEQQAEQVKIRKGLPEQHEKLKAKHEAIQTKHKELLEEMKALRQQLKEKKTDSKATEAALGKLQRLAEDYIADTVKFAFARLTASNYSANRDRITKIVEKCRAYGFDISDNVETERIEELQDEFKRLVRLNEQRAEQARIKAQMREEEKLRRELEKVREQAEREQAAAEKALREAVARAEEEARRKALTDAERAASDAEIEALKQREAEAEAKAQRATSQAQLTKAGNVYVISNIGSFGEEVFKIGMTRREEPMDRVKELGDASVPFPFEVHMMIASEDAPKLENALHRRFRHRMLNRTNPRREFFKLDLEEIKQAVKEHSEGGTITEFVVDAELLEYIQSQRMSESDAEFIEKTFEELGPADMTDID